MSWIVPRPSGPEGAGVLEVTGPECDSAVINADRLFPNSGARIIDCQAGWAVMASAVSGDRYWVAFSDGRWRRVADVSIRLGTCPAEAVAKGAPAWMAQKHLSSCAPSGRASPPAPTLTPTPRADVGGYDPGSAPCVAHPDQFADPGPDRGRRGAGDEFATDQCRHADVPADQCRHDDAFADR